MADPSTELSDADLIALFSGTAPTAGLVKALHRSDDAVQLAIATRAAHLHNAGNIDLFALAGDPGLLGLGDFARFRIDQFIAKALPKLEAVPAAMMSFLRALIANGGRDGLWLDGFKAWCAMDAERWRAVIRAIDAEEPGAEAFLPAALQASNDLD